MLPECRCEEYLYPIPRFALERNEVSDFNGELKEFHAQFGDCFSRSEPRENFYRYMAGQFSELERKSIEPIATRVEGGDVRSMQRFVSEIAWDEKGILSKYRSMVNEDIGDPNGVLIFDESGFVKKGEESAGVARQYCGSIGKVENSQVGVFAAYASPHGYALIDKRLFVPEKWFGEDYVVKRKKCEMPEHLEFNTKPQLAAEMFKELVEQKELPFKYILSDTVYGNSPDFINALEDCTGKIYLLSIPSDMLCWLTRPLMVKKQYRYKGEERFKEMVEDDNKPLSVETIARNTNDFFWYRRKVSEGTKGPIEYEFMKRRVVFSKNGKPEKTRWLIIKRTIGSAPTYSYYMSNAPASTRLKTFVWLSGVRWAIEQCFEETKTELGMDHYEVRKYRGWNQHILTCMLAHFFLWHLKIRLGKKSSIYYALAA